MHGCLTKRHLLQALSEPYCYTRGNKEGLPHSPCLYERQQCSGGRAGNNAAGGVQVRRTTVADVQRRLLQEGNAMVSAHHSASRRSSEAAKHIALLHIIQARHHWVSAFPTSAS